MRRALFGIIAFALCLSMLSWRAPYDEKPSDSELLGKAIEYFQSGKFHEALLLFDKLDNRYKLNPRFRAFLAVCYYYDWDDEKTCELLDSLIPQLEPFAPHERSIYYYINAESHFNLKQYDKAVPYYEQALNVCYNNEKPDAFYRMGYCYLFNGDTLTAYDYMRSALAYYQQFRNREADQPRMAQLEKMVRGLQPDAGVLWATLPPLEEQQATRDTLRSRIIDDIDLSDIFEHTIIVEEEE
jgi:tetratricopeptide (TPR) repeat protein